MIKLRNYQNPDYPFVKEILQEAGLFDKTWDSEENLAGMIAQDSEAIIVAVEGNTVVGNVLLVPYGPKVIYLFRLAVKKEYHGQGIATRLIEKSEEIAKKKGVKELGLYLNSQDARLKSFYQKRDFKTSPKPLAYHYLWKKLKLNSDRG